MTYPEFIVQEYLSDTHNVLLNRPKLEDGSKPRFINKLGPYVYLKVYVEVLDIYTRSAKLKLIFDGGEREDIFYMSSHKSPELIYGEIYKKIDKIVNKAMIEDGREDWIREEYTIKQNLLDISIQNIVSKIKEIDEKRTE